MPPMVTTEEEAILVEASAIAAGEMGGALATLHAEDGTPYVTFVLFHLLPDGAVLFGSGPATQHARNMDATPEVSFLIDNREVIKGDWNTFCRIVIEGEAARVSPDDNRYPGFIAAMHAKGSAVATFAERGNLFRIHPRRLIMRYGLQPERLIIDFDQDPRE